MGMFESKTQYDKSYLGIDNNRSVCSIFSLLTAEQYLLDGNISKEKHDWNLDQAVQNYINFGIKGHLSFQELLDIYSKNYSDSDTGVTSLQLIKDNVISYQHIFGPHNNSYGERFAYIFLKSSKFFVVLFSPTIGAYHVRDCHSTIQYSFDSLPKLVKHLRQFYEFETEIVLTDPDGTKHTVGEFNNIEFLVLQSTKPVDSIFIYSSEGPLTQMAEDKKMEVEMKAEVKKKEPKPKPNPGAKIAGAETEAEAGAKAGTKMNKEMVDLIMAEIARLNKPSKKKPASKD